MVIGLGPAAERLLGQRLLGERVRGRHQRIGAFEGSERGGVVTLAPVLHAFFDEIVGGRRSGVCRAWDDRNPYQQQRRDQEVAGLHSMIFALLAPTRGATGAPGLSAAVAPL